MKPSRSFTISSGTTSADWYIEMAKIRLRSGSEPSPLPTLAHVLERTLRLLHPFMPFITEEIWQNLLEQLPQEGDLPASIMVAPYPQADASSQDTQAEGEISLVMQAIRAVRNTRAQLRIPANEQLEAIVEANGFQKAIEEEAEVIRSLSRINPLRVTAASDAGEQPRGITLVVNPLIVRLPLEGVVDLGEEAERLRKELDDCQKNLDRVSALVSNPRLPRQGQTRSGGKTKRNALKSLEERRQRLNEILGQLES